jgi:hypothetical protein
MAPPLQNKSKYRQGIFKPKNTNKFIGGNSAVYRSGLELKFMRFCDNNPNIIKWGSENIIVPYISPVDNKVHRYYVDNFVVIKEGSIVRKYLIEIKPFKQLSPPTTKYKKKEHLLYEQGQYNINQAKWNAAREHAKRIGCEFMILTEKELG